MIDKLPRFKKRMQWFLSHNEIFLNHLVSFEIKATKELDPKIMLSIPTKEQLERVLQYVLDEEEFSPPMAYAPSLAITTITPLKQN